MTASSMDDSVLEELKEENHSLKLKLEQLRQVKDAELEYLRDELALKEREHKDALEKVAHDAKNRENELQERVSALNEDLIGSREELERLKDLAETLKANYDHLRSRSNDSYAHRRSNNVSFTMEHYEALKDALEEKESDLAKAKEQISGLSERLSEYSAIVEADRSRIAEMAEEVESKQNTIVELQDRVRQMEVERSEHIQMQQQRQLEGESAVGASSAAATAARGNSLFSEVEERRVKVEDELKRLRERNASLIKENLELQASIESGDRRHSAVSNQLQILTRSEQQMINELKKFKSEGLNLFDNYRTRLEKLREEYLSMLGKYKAAGAETKPELEKVTAERDELLVKTMTLDRQIFELKKDLRYAQHMKTECEAHLKILRIKYNESVLEKKSSSPRRSKNSDNAATAAVAAAVAAALESPSKKRSDSPQNSSGSSGGSTHTPHQNGVSTQPGQRVSPSSSSETTPQKKKVTTEEISECNQQ